MYEQYYGLTEAPFQLLPDPSFLYMSKDHGMALTLLRYSMLNKQGFTAITGEVGAGKTTLINRILEEMDDEVTIGLSEESTGRIARKNAPFMLQAR